MTPKTVVVTGSTGFLGGRLSARLRHEDRCRVVPVNRDAEEAVVERAIAGAAAVAHMAGVTRPQTAEEFAEGNLRLTERLTAIIRSAGNTPLVLFASTMRVTEDTEYGRTKRAAEKTLLALGAEIGAPVLIYRLGQLFGVGAKPYYNAISATLLADAAQGRATQLNRPDEWLDLVDAEDVVREMVAAINEPERASAIVSVTPAHRATVGTIAAIAAQFGRGDRPDAADPLQVALYRAFQWYRDELKPMRSPHTA